MRLSARILGAGALSLLAALATSASAQQVSAALLTPKLNALSTQPIFDILGFYNLEYERVIGPSTTFGIQANFSNDDWYNFADEQQDPRYSSFDAKLRYYPSGRALEGFAVAATLGAARYSSLTPTECFFLSCGGGREPRVSVVGAKLGFELDYNWLLGADEKFIVAVGVGAKRFLGDSKFVTTAEGDRYEFDVPNVYPTARLAIGFAW